MPLPPQFNGHLMRLNVRCPICHTVYDFQRLKILGEMDQQVLTYIECGTCSTALISILSLGPSGVTAQGLVTDLTMDEVTDLDVRDFISHDDVLDIHELLDANPAALTAIRH